jgi:hypothetical protein
MQLLPRALLLAIVLLNLPPRAGATLLEEDPPRSGFTDFAAEFVPGELIVMFRADAGHHVPDARRMGFEPLLGDPTAGSLDELIRNHSVHDMRRVFRGLEDRNGELRFTARERAARRDRAPGRPLQANFLDRVPALENIFLLRLDPSADVHAAAEDFARDERVIFAEPNYVFRILAEPLPSAAFIPNDPYLSRDGLHWSDGAFGETYPDLYGLRNIRAIESWNQFDTDGSGDFGAGERRPGEGVVIAVVDSGLDPDHPDISVNVWTNPGEVPDNGIDDDGNGYVDDVHGWDFVEHDDSPADGHGHGTHVTGTVGANADNALGIIGVAPWSEIMPLKGLSDLGSGSAANLAAAVDYAVAMGADVISNSWGGGISSGVIEAAFANAHALSS